MLTINKKFLQNLQGRIDRIFDFNANSIYLALFIYLYLSMFQINPVFRLLLSFSTILHVSVWRMVCALAISIACVVYYWYFPFFESVAAYVILLGIGVFCTEYRKMCKQNLKNHCMLLLFSMLANLILDLSMKYGWEGFQSTYLTCPFPNTMYRVIGMYLIIHLIALINLFVRRYQISSMIGFNLIFLLGAIHYWTMEVTNKEFVLKDLLLVKTVAKVIDGVQLHPGDVLYFLFYIALVIGFNILLCRCPWETIKTNNIKQAAVTTFWFLMCIVFLLADVFGDFSYKTYLKYGFTSNLISGIEIEKEPTGSEDFLKNMGNIDTPDKTEDLEEVNIIMIMSEAFSDLSVLGSFETNQDFMPYTRKLMETTPSGYLYSPVYGNNTASTEYECLTGIPTAFAKTGGELYQLYMKEERASLVSYFHALGYQTIGLHPYDRVGYNREAAWQSFGFDKTLFQEDFKDAKTVRDFVSDESFYNKIIEEYENGKEASPLFMFGVSMQNHATFLTDYPDNIKLENLDYPDVQEYLSLISRTDEANRKLIEHFSRESEKTMIVFFGDHQPMLDTNFYEEVTGEDFYEMKDKEPLKYKVPYFIWTNYESEHTVPEEISANYLPYVMIEALNYPQTPWYELLEELQIIYSVITPNFIKYNNKWLQTDNVKQELGNIAAGEQEKEHYCLKKYQVWSREKAMHKEK